MQSSRNSSPQRSRFPQPRLASKCAIIYTRIPRPRMTTGVSCHTNSFIFLVFGEKKGGLFLKDAFAAYKILDWWIFPLHPSMFYCVLSMFYCVPLCVSWFLSPTSAAFGTFLFLLSFIFKKMILCLSNDLPNKYVYACRLVLLSAGGLQLQQKLLICQRRRLDDGECSPLNEDINVTHPRFKEHHRRGLERM